MIDELHMLLGHVRSAFSRTIEVQRPHFSAADFRFSTLTCERVPKRVEPFPSRCATRVRPILQALLWLVTCSASLSLVVWCWTRSKPLGIASEIAEDH
jgi:hypothetical protein